VIRDWTGLATRRCHRSGDGFYAFSKSQYASAWSPSALCEVTKRSTKRAWMVIIGGSNE